MYEANHVHAASEIEAVKQAKEAAEVATKKAVEAAEVEEKQAEEFAKQTAEAEKKAGAICNSKLNGQAEDNKTKKGSLQCKRQSKRIVRTICGH